VSKDDRTLVDQVPRTLRSEVRVALDRPDSPRTPTLTIVTGPSPGRFVSIEQRSRAVFIGRDATCEFSIDDPSVSRRHARLYQDSTDATVVVLQDLDSTNGTLVNGNQVDRRALRHGDRVHIGDVLLRFEMLDRIDIAYRDGVARRVEEGERDALTGLLGRSALQSNLPSLLQDCVDREAPVSAVMLDLDHFKRVNDTRGHAAGDEVLRVTGELLEDTIRKEDLAIRYGGEEFLLILSGARRLHARLLAERLREKLAAVQYPTMPDLYVTCSLGVAEWVPGEPIEDWLDRADKALYRAKERGRNRSEAAPTPRPG
jgi:two-component system, cell cycle response regulator